MDNCIYKCKICSKGFLHNSSLREHEHVHDITEPAKCCNCNKTFSTVKAMKYHESNAQCKKNKAINDIRDNIFQGNIPDLEEALNVERLGEECTLLITEGLSARNFAKKIVIKLNKRQNWGVLALKGTLKNCTKGSMYASMTDPQIQKIVHSIGLSYKETYCTSEDLKKLKYSRVILMFDAGHGGSHLIGLSINIFHNYWPKLLEQGFISIFVSPLVKMERNIINDAHIKEFNFYTLLEVSNWTLNTPGHIKNIYDYSVVRGLGGLRSADINALANHFRNHCVQVVYNEKEDSEVFNTAFNFNFEKKEMLMDDYIQTCKNSQKDNLQVTTAFLPRLYSITCDDFIKHDLAAYWLFSKYSNTPSCIDGLKPGERKIIYTLLHDDDKSETYVQNICANASRKTEYLSSAEHLYRTVVLLAQSYIGANNYPLLIGDADFGTRGNGGNDYGKPHYIKTRIHNNAIELFNEMDNRNIQHQQFLSRYIEPLYLIPLLPVILIKGFLNWCSTNNNVIEDSIPQFHIRDILLNMILRCLGEKPKPLLPWYKGFNGVVERINDTTFKIVGTYKILNNKQICITEIPISFKTYKTSCLDSLLSKEEIFDYDESITDNDLKYTITMSEDYLEKLTKDKDGILNKFKLQTIFKFTKIHLVNSEQEFQKFSSLSEIEDYFFDLKLLSYKEVITEDQNFVQETEIYLRKLLQFNEYLNSINYPPGYHTDYDPMTINDDNLTLNTNDREMVSDDGCIVQDDEAANNDVRTADADDAVGQSYHTDYDLMAINDDNLSVNTNEREMLVDDGCVVQQDETVNEEDARTEDGVIQNEEIVKNIRSRFINKKAANCEVCDKIFKDKKRLTRHMISHSNDKPFVCDICQKSFKMKQHLVEHKAIHNKNRKLFECDVCGKTFTATGKFNIHYKKHTH